MPALTPSFLFDLESNMQVITEDEYARIAANLWWSKFVNVLPSKSRRELVTWLLSTARIQDLEKLGGKAEFEDLVSAYAEFTVRYSGAALHLKKEEIEDLDGSGLQLAAKWSGDVGQYMGYWPQEKIIDLLKNGHLSTSVGYDGVAFFSSSHPTNPTDASVGTYKNIFTGSASGSYPGACPIDDSVTPDVALKNIGKVVAYIRSLKMPNGVTPRFLRPRYIVAPPALQTRVVQVTNAKFMAQAAASGGGSGDVEAVIQTFGWDVPIIADELAGFESDTTYFVMCEEMGSTKLGAFVYVEREPFRIDYYSGAGGQNVDLSRMDELEWHCKGRNVAGYGHPYTAFKCKGS